jgi:hypothetical protein
VSEGDAFECDLRSSRVTPPLSLSIIHPFVPIKKKRKPRDLAYSAQEVSE